MLRHWNGGPAKSYYDLSLPLEMPTACRVFVTNLSTVGP